ncbi:HlyD family efflux transporter periplasmic adaptor subunit [Patescibacteria group bacterium]|nr:HlyD family efflux transporter periplasmic adaptor subunit [Patescibacteria group bacterium]MDE1946278.1 HlyD family efflux transporter periplasmic adaptor subunit [Patescibacteria group bacterium]MDE2010730.1 HlyD family efflux transporter periplasmic adaptor subunit [Patescibacteria group bacterium]MDE2232614.1 HlyD family efflux transporter periplasmic adaptor subunit [Patescibacteria group bacterium]
MFNRIKKILGAHKVISVFAIILIAVIVYLVFRSVGNANAETQYTISRAHLGSVTQTVTGTGQVSAADQLDVTSQVSGTIETIDAAVGQHVNRGQLLATIDDTQALNNLENAKIAYAKLIESPKATDVANAQNILAQSYSSAFNTVSSTFIDLPAVISGMKDMLYSQGTFLSDQKSSYLIPSARTYRDQTGASYDKANAEYTVVIEEYKNMSRTSATSSIEQLLSDTYNMAKDVAATLQNAQNTVTFITTVQPDYLTSTASSAATSINTWSNTINNDVANLLSAQNTIQSDQNALTNLTAAPDSLDIQSQQLSVDQAQQTYDNYFIRAPFDGIVGRIPVSVYDQAGNGTVIATVIGNRKIATISLNEIDAAKVKTGQPVDITFDAINGLNATGTVSEVDLVGTVNQGVVTYDVKIAINTDDPRILPGMSVNATIITKEDKGVLVVPSTAIKTQGNQNYVQVFDKPALPVPIIRNNAVSSTTYDNHISESASSTSQFNGSQSFGSSTHTFYGQSAAGTSRTSAGITISSATAPRNVTVTVGNSDDSNTEIISGLQVGQWVVTRTTSGSAAQTTSAPSILNSFGGNRGGPAGGAVFRAVRGG